MTNITQNRQAFLDMIAHSELGDAILSETDNGYNVIVGSTPSKLILMGDYKNHPHKVISLSPTLKSSAAGRYQLLGRYYDYYSKLLNLPDFGHDSQDTIALQQIKECKALEDIDAGRFEMAVSKCSHIWASLPNAGYGQRENSIAYLKEIYLDSGGTLA
jgi:muramidase (phage lysozyme)